MVLLLNVLLSARLLLHVKYFLSFFLCLSLCADLHHSPSCRGCLSLQIQFRTRLGPNYLISSACYPRLVSFPYKDHYVSFSCLKCLAKNRVLEYHLKLLDNYDKFCCKKQGVTCYLCHVHNMVIFFYPHIGVS